MQTRLTILALLTFAVASAAQAEPVQPRPAAPYNGLQEADATRQPYTPQAPAAPAPIAQPAATPAPQVEDTGVKPVMMQLMDF